MGNFAKKYLKKMITRTENHPQGEFELTEAAGEVVTDFFQEFDKDPEEPEDMPIYSAEEQELKGKITTKVKKFLF